MQNYNKTTNRQYPPFYKDLRVNNLRLRAQALLEFYGKGKCDIARTHNCAHMFC